MNASERHPRSTGRAVARCRVSYVALEDEAAMTIEDPDSEGEDRFVSVGMDDQGRMLVTVFTYRGDAIRIVSSRRASKRERRWYEEGP